LAETSVAHLNLMPVNMSQLLGIQRLALQFLPPVAELQCIKLYLPNLIFFTAQGECP